MKALSDIANKLPNGDGFAEQFTSTSTQVGAELIEKMLSAALAATKGATKVSIKVGRVTKKVAKATEDFMNGDKGVSLSELTKNGESLSHVDLNTFDEKVVFTSVLDKYNVKYNVEDLKEKGEQAVRITYPSRQADIVVLAQEEVIKAHEFDKNPLHLPAEKDPTAERWLGYKESGELDVIKKTAEKHGVSYSVSQDENGSTVVELSAKNSQTLSEMSIDCVAELQKYRSEKVKEQGDKGEPGDGEPETPSTGNPGNDDIGDGDKGEPEAGEPENPGTGNPGNDDIGDGDAAATVGDEPNPNGNPSLSSAAELPDDTPDTIDEMASKDRPAEEPELNKSTKETTPVKSEEKSNDTPVLDRTQKTVETERSEHERTVPELQPKTKAEKAEEKVSDTSEKVSLRDKSIKERIQIAQQIANRRNAEIAAKVKDKNRVHSDR